MKLLPSSLVTSLMLANLVGAADERKPNILFILADDQSPIGPGEQSCPRDLENHTVGTVFNRGGSATMRTRKRGNSWDRMLWLPDTTAFRVVAPAQHILDDSAGMSVVGSRVSNHQNTYV